MASVKINSIINNQPARKGLISTTIGLINKKTMIVFLYQTDECPRKLCQKAILKEGCAIELPRMGVRGSEANALKVLQITSLIKKSNTGSQISLATFCL